MFKPFAAFGAALALLVTAAAGNAAGQSPNNSSIVVLVTDQSGAVVRDAKVLVTNEQTGATREAVSGAEGSASFPGLSLTGTYSVVVTKPGFGDESRGGLTLRSGETATV